MIIIIMRGKNFVAHLDGLGGTPIAHHWSKLRLNTLSAAASSDFSSFYCVRRGKSLTFDVYSFRTLKCITQQ
jgi:hypothetical protein